jgi:group I intron endonuclease
MKDITIENLQEYLNVPGIYYIQINTKNYVGSSASIGHRLKHHLWALKSGKHHNRTMQNCWNKYQTIEFKVLEKCNPDLLLEREQFYIESLTPYMNHILDPIKLTRDDTYKQRLSISMKKLYANGLEIHNKQEVHMYSLDGKYIKTFPSITEAASSFKTDPSGICAVLNSRAKSAKKHLWSTSKHDQIELPTKNYQVKSVVQYDNTGYIKIKEWSSVKLAERTLNISNVHRAARKHKIAGGFKWKFE